MADSVRRSTRKRRDSIAPKSSLDLFPFSPELKRKKEPKTGPLKRARAPNAESGPAASDEKKAAASSEEKRSSSVTDQKNAAPTPVKRSTRTPVRQAAISKRLPPSPSVSRRTTGNSAGTTREEVEDLLLETKRNTEYEKLLVDKDKAYAELYEKHNKLKAMLGEGQATLLAEITARAEKNEKLSGTTIQALKAEATVAHTKLQQSITELDSLKKAQVKNKSELAKLMKQVEELTKQNGTLSADLRVHQETAGKNKTLEETYRLLTAMEIVHTKDATFRCKIVNHHPFRIVEFDLTCEQDAIFYKPLKINLKGAEYPGYLKERLRFEPAQTPLLMKTLINTIYSPTPQHSQEFTPSKTSA